MPRWAFLLSGALVLLLALSACPRRNKNRKGRGDRHPRGSSTAPVKKVQKKDRTSGSVSAEKGPHPDFPTPRLAETEKIFLMEEPDRGPLVTSATIPPELTNRWTFHAHCEVTVDGVACGPGQKAAGLRYHWRVRRGGMTELAQERFGPRLMRSYLLYYTKGQALDRMVALDRRGQVLWSRHYGASASRYSSRRLNGSNGLSGCGFYQLQRDARRKTRLDVGCLQWTGQPMKDTNGVVYTRQLRDRAGFSVETRELDRKKKPINGQDGVHRTAFERDRAGRVVRRLFRDTEGFPTLSTRSGCHGWAYRYDGRGLLERKSCLGSGGKPINDRLGVCAYVHSHDGRGCRTSVVNLKLDSTKKCTRQFKKYAYEVDTSCQIMVQTCHGATDKRKTCGLRQPAEYRYGRDEQGRVTSIKHFAIDHQPGKDLSCKAFEVRKQYDKRGNLKKISYHGSSGQAVDCHGTGYHGIRYVVDEAGRTKETRFINRAGQRGTNLGCAVRRFEYDNYDHLVRTINFDFDGSIKDVRGMAAKRMIFDQGHRLFGVLLDDVHGKPARYRACFTARTCPSRGTWHAVRIMRRKNGSVSRNLFFDHNGQLVFTVDCAKVPCWK